MSIQQDVLKRAAARIGYYAPNDPKPGSEAGRYWAKKTGLSWLAGPSQSVWWCMLFVSMCLDEVGQIDAIGGFSYNTDVTLNRNRSRIVPVSQAQPGDVVIYNWGFRGGTDHVGFVEKNLGNGWIQTIEGNTSSGSAGAQSSGNGVWRRRRNNSIAAIIRPAYKGPKAVQSTPISKPVKKTKTDKQLALDVDGSWGGATNARFLQVFGHSSGLQHFLNSVVSTHDIRNLTGDAHLAEDNELGPKTWKVFQFWAGNKRPDLIKAYAGYEFNGSTLAKWCDGKLGPATIKVVQHMLNASYANSQKFLSR